jgi:hypothetical protein
LLAEERNLALHHFLSFKSTRQIMIKIYLLSQSVLLALILILQIGLIGLDIESSAVLAGSYCISSILTILMLSRIKDGVARSLIFAVNVIMCFIYSCMFLFSAQVESTIMFTFALALMVITLSASLMVVILLRL